MNSKYLLLLIAGVCGTVAAVASSQMMQAGTEEQVEMVDVLVAVKNVQRMQQVTPQHVKLESWPKQSAPPGATDDLAKVEKMYAKFPIFAGEPIILTKLNKERATASQHLREHHKVVTMKADPNSSVTNLVKPGDVVDIMGFFVESEVIPSTESRIVMRGVRVFALDARYTVDDDDSGEGSRGVKTVALEIHEDQAKTFDLANHLGKLSLQMRPINDAFSEADADEEQMKSSEDFLNWLGRHQVERKRQAAERAEAELARLNARRNPRRPVQRPATPPAAPTIKPETAPSRLVQAVPAAAEPVVEKIRMQKIVDGQVIVYELDSDTGLFSVLNADQNSGGVTANDVDPIEAMIKSSNDKSADSSKSKKSSDDSDSISFLDE